MLHDVDLYIRKREFITLLGPSGCGKTTLLRIIGGFETPDEGAVLFEGADMGNVPPYRRRINTVFQKYALFSHLNVFDNIAFGLNLKAPEALGVKTRRQRSGGSRPPGEPDAQAGKDGGLREAVDRPAFGGQQRASPSPARW